jgi:hypothetical protein
MPRKKKKKPVRVSTFSLHRLRKVYPFVDNVEQTIPHTFIKRDLYGFADYAAFNSVETVLVQVTTRKNMPARIAKILASAKARLWVVGEGRRIVVHGWVKRPIPFNKKVKVWVAVEREITQEDFV